MRRRTSLHLVCVAGSAESAMLPHMIGHYRRLGVESFYLVRHALTTGDPGFAQVADTVAAADLQLFHTYVGPWSLQIHQRLVRHVMSLHPGDWFIIADTDQLNVHDRPLHDLVELCETDGFDHINGCFLDRVAAGGDFPEVNADPLWERYPLGGSISAALVRALPLKVAMARGHVELLTGQHGAPEGSPLPAERHFTQEHHFKWTGDVVGRLRRRVELFEQGRWNVNSAIIRETRRFLSHVGRHGDRIDVS